MSGGLFNKTVTDVKETVFRSLVIYIEEPAAVNFFKKGSLPETKRL
jgi:hypothetical protein